MDRQYPFQLAYVYSADTKKRDSLKSRFSTMGITCLWDTPFDSLPKNELSKFIRLFWVGESWEEKSARRFFLELLDAPVDPFFDPNLECWSLGENLSEILDRIF